MSESQTVKEDIFLRYGDTIMLFHNKDLLKGGNQGQAHDGLMEMPFLCSYGFVDTRVRL